MEDTSLHLVATALTAVVALLALGGCVFTWLASRAKKVRALEDAVLGEMHEHRHKISGFETRLAEWQTTIQSMLAEVEEFFERTVRERKRIAARQSREMEGNTPAFESMTREQQKEIVRQQFEGR